MPNELIAGFVVISLDGGVLDRPVHSLDLSIIRYVILGFAVCLFPRGSGRYGEPIWTRAPEARWCGRPLIDGPRARARYMAARRDFPGCAAGADQ